MTMVLQILLPTTMLSQEPVTAKALGPPATATYQLCRILFRIQTTPSNYNSRYNHNSQLPGTVGTMTATAPVQPNTGVFRFETYSHEKAVPTPIAADGSTTINVYCQPATYHRQCASKEKWSILATLTLRYGEAFNLTPLTPIMAMWRIATTFAAMQTTLQEPNTIGTACSWCRRHRNHLPGKTTDQDPQNYCK